MVRIGTGSGTLVTVQGAHAIQEDVFSIWDQVAPERWTVITPVASEPNGDGGWEWPHSMDASVEGLITDLTDLAFSSPLILNGFSIGSAIACHVINSSRMDVEGLIAMRRPPPGSSMNSWRRRRWIDR
jgi:surfactin synthase thioesterase subunit